MKYILLIILISTIGANAQNEFRYTEKDIAFQGKFIKASQKRLIGKLDDAISIYKTILEKDPYNALVLFNLSRIYLEKNDEDKAVSYGEKAIKKAPDNPWYQKSLADIMMNFDEYEQAAELYEKLITLQKNNQGHYYSAIEAYHKAENTSGRLSIFRKMEDNFGADDYTIQQIVGIYLDQGNNKDALLKAQELIHLYPNDPHYYELNGQLQSDFGSSDKAMEYYTKLLKIYPNNSSALVYLARNTGKQDELSQIEMIATNPSVNIDSKVKSLIPFAKEITADHPQKERIIQLANNIIEIHPEESKAYTLLADLLANTGNIEEAERQYIKALEFDKSIYAVWQQLMIIQNDLGKYDALILSSEQALNYYPNQAAPYIYNGLAQSELGNYEVSKEMLEEAKLIGTKDDFIKGHLKLLSGKIVAHSNGEDIKEMTREEIFMKGLKPGDARIIMNLSNGNFLVRVQKGS